MEGYSRKRTVEQAESALKQRVDGSVAAALKDLDLNDSALNSASNVYDKLVELYPVTIGKAVSKKQREEENLKDSTLVYGEIHFKTFALAFEKIRHKYGGLRDPGGVFIDIGSGMGKPVFAAMLLHEFDVVVGVEVLSNLHKVSLDILDAWNKMKSEADVSAKTRETMVKFICGDALTTDWDDARLCFANSTCFTEELMEGVARKVDLLAPGTFFVTFTRRIPSQNWHVLEYERYLMSWGEATVYIQVRRNDDGSIPEFVNERINAIAVDDPSTSNDQVVLDDDA